MSAIVPSEQLRHLHDDGVEHVGRSSPFGDDGRDSAKRRLLLCQAVHLATRLPPCPRLRPRHPPNRRGGWPSGFGALRRRRSRPQGPSGSPPGSCRPVIAMSPLTITRRSPIGWKKATRGSTCAVPDNRGRPVHQRGVTRWPGLCFLGLTWQYTRTRRSWAGRRTTPSPSRARSTSGAEVDPHGGPRSSRATGSTSRLTSTRRPEERRRRTGKCAERQTAHRLPAGDQRKLLNPAGPASRPRQA
jgi:hypothetical protein